MSGNINKIWGERRRILYTTKTEIDLLYLKADTFCSTHTHQFKINRFLVVEGKVRIETEFGDVILEKNQSWEVHPFLRHRFVPLTNAVMIEMAYVIEGQIDPDDIMRFGQGGRIIDGKEMTHDELRNKGLLDL